MYSESKIRHGQEHLETVGQIDPWTKSRTSHVKQLNKNDILIEEDEKYKRNFGIITPTKICFCQFLLLENKWYIKELTPNPMTDILDRCCWSHHKSQKRVNCS